MSIQVNALEEAELMLAFRAIQRELLARDPSDPRLWNCQPAGWKMRAIKTEHLRAVIEADQRLHRASPTEPDMRALHQWQVAAVGATLADSVVDFRLCMIAPEQLGYFCADLFMSCNRYRLLIDPATVVQGLIDTRAGIADLGDVAALLFAHSEPAEPAA